MPSSPPHLNIALRNKKQILVSLLSRYLFQLLRKEEADRVHVNLSDSTETTKPHLTFKI